MSEQVSTAGVDFRISSFSGGGNCVEIGRLPDGSVAIRHSGDPAADETLVFTGTEWVAFLQGAKAGEFDAL